MLIFSYLFVNNIILYYIILYNIMLHQKIYLITYGSGKYNNTKYRLKQ